MTHNGYKTIIIGAGAAGLYLAALLALRGDGKGTALLESQPRTGKKLSATGNGQGNLSNADMSPAHYHCAAGADSGLISEITGYNILESFDGLFTCDERGRIYPAGRQASALSDGLRRKAEKGGVTFFINEKAVCLRARVSSACNPSDPYNDKALAEKPDTVNSRGGFTVTTESGLTLTGKTVVLATGGNAQKQFGSDGSGYALAKSLGHTVTPLTPSLVQLKTDTAKIKPLKGLRTDCTVKCADKCFGGEVIFADYGVTGSAVFNLSPYVTAGDTLSFDLMPSVDTPALIKDIQKKKELGYENDELLDLTMHRQLARAVIKSADSASPADIAAAAKAFKLTVTGSLGFDYAQVTRGGIPFAEVTSSLESKLCPGLYFAGEILDIDGDCGGYNLHWAFASAARVADAIYNLQCTMYNL